MDKDLKRPKISIIMPAYNASNYIGEAITSVIAQTFTSWELIIVDDGSVDATAKIANEWVTKDQRIQYYYQENGKQGKARNLGISKSKGVYLAFLDADDIWMPEKLEIQLQEIKEKNVDLVFSDSYIIRDAFEAIKNKRMNIPNGVFYAKDDLNSFLEENKIPILTVLVKKEKVVDVGGFSEVLDVQNVEDYHLWLKLLMTNCAFYASGNVLAEYRIHNHSATANDKQALDKIPAAFFDLLQQYPSYKSQIRQELKIKFKLLYKRNLFTKDELSIWIKKNTQYFSKTQLSYLYLLLNFLLPTKVTKRILIYLLNA